MPNCINCSKKLTILNKPTFKLGVLLDSNEICFKCYSKLSKLNNGKEPQCKTLTQKDVIETLNPPKRAKEKKDNIITIVIK